MEDSRDKEEALVEEEDEVVDFSNVIIEVYWDIIKDISHSCSVCVCIVLRLITQLRNFHN